MKHIFKGEYEEASLFPFSLITYFCTAIVPSHGF